MDSYMYVINFAIFVVNNVAGVSHQITDYMYFLDPFFLHCFFLLVYELRVLLIP